MEAEGVDIGRMGGTVRAGGPVRDIAKTAQERPGKAAPPFLRLTQPCLMP